ncbi:carbonyl reductase [NADPH] 3-like [Epargyreus clarus]|uniref:carbonyl reductase [NADPH] 3-like n=1 Tax=Epargyreus clarus TaxID=520877 RepID=UPI003C309545
MADKVAVVTGSNKGLGFAIVKRLCEKYSGKVYLTSRDKERGMNAVKELVKLDLHPEYHQLDVTDRQSVEKFRDHIKETHGGIDILINNAGIAANFFAPSYEEDKKIIDTNFKSIFTIEEFLYPLLRENGRVLNISSDCGHLSNLRNKYWIEKFVSKNFSLTDVNDFVNWFLDSSRDGTFKREDFADWGIIAAYRVAKVALSAVTMLQQKDLEARNISINSMHPGLVRTDMTAKIGFFTSEQAAETPVHIVLDAPQSLKGAYLWYDGTVVDWFDYKSDHFFKSWSVASWFPYSWLANIFSYFSSRFGY